MQARKVIIWFVMAMLGLCGMGVLGFLTSIRPPRITSEDTPETFGWPFEAIAFQSTDGIRLAGWYLPAVNEAKKTVIMMHGYPADKGDILSLGAFLRLHYNLLFFDFRYFGHSEGSYSTAGAKEVHDLLGAIRWLEERGKHTIGVLGFSMGGAVGLLALEKTKKINAVVADSPYANLGDMAFEQFGGLWILKYPLGWILRGCALAFLGVDPSQVSPERAIRQADTPVLLIHSRYNDVIPASHAERLEAAVQERPFAEAWILDGVPHGAIHAHQPGEYEAKVLDFFKRFL